MDQNELSYFEFIPDELVYIIVTYMGSKNYLNRLPSSRYNRYNRIYATYMNNIINGREPPSMQDIQDLKKGGSNQLLQLIHNGTINLFNCSAPEETILRRFVKGETNNPAMYERKVKSTSLYFRNVLNYKREEDFDISFTSISKDVKCMIYIKISSGQDGYSVINVFISNKDNIRTLYKVSRTTMIASQNTEHESYNWKEIWDKLPVEDQNALLYQNGFSLKA